MPLGYRSGSAGFVVTRYPVVLAQSIFCPRQTQWTRLTGCPVIYDGADVELMLRVPGRRWQRSHKGPSEYILAHLSADVKRETKVFPRLPKFQRRRHSPPPSPTIIYSTYRSTHHLRRSPVAHLSFRCPSTFPHQAPGQTHSPPSVRPHAWIENSPTVLLPAAHQVLPTQHSYTPPVSATDTALSATDQTPAAPRLATDLYGQLGYSYRVTQFWPHG